MNVCPKCNSYRIYGPRYIKGPYGGESLRYECAQCGYSEHEATRDSDERHPANTTAPDKTGGGV